MRTRSIAQMAVVVLAVGLVGAVPVAQGAGEPGVVHFTAAGDFGATPNTATVLSGMAAAAPDLALALGDLSYGATGQEQAWCDLVTQRMGAGFPFQLLAGNHESNGQNGNINDFSACLPNQLPGLVGTYGRQWYVDVPQVDPLVRFVMISPAIPFPDGSWSYAAGSPRYAWTAGAIDGARSAGIPWVVVGTHKPCFSLGQYSCEIGADLTNMLVSKRVDLVLHGHEHLYQRTHQLGTRSGCAAVPAGSVDADCVVDSDASMSQGAGTVFATAGAAGVELRDVDAGDTEAGYFAAASGGNQDPAYGFLDVRVTADSLQAGFVPVSGSFTDAFTITRGAAPPNTPPTAAFTSSSNGMTATFDGRGSTDGDGTIASYSWDFGDGSPAVTGAQPQHAYASGGTYPVTLTVTDDDGAPASVTRQVTVTAPGSTTDLARDGFDRSVANGLGTADTGGPWSTSGTASNFAVAGGAGAVTIPAAGNTRAAWLGSVASSDTDLLLRLSLDRRPSNSGAYLDVVGRRVAQNTEYRARVVLAGNGRVTVALTALRGSSSPVTLASGLLLPTSITYDAGTELDVRFQVTGTGPTTLRLKVWPAGTAEPAAWQRTATDSWAGLQAAGGVGLTGYLSGSVTNAPVVVRMLELTARPVE